MPVVQAKLRIGKPNDPYEQEADRVAEEVTRLPTRSSSSGTGGTVVPEIVHDVFGLPRLRTGPKRPSFHGIAVWP